jgi:flavin reductase (DIM6/NTAB) family NADH-FMN oxidoreductase RutF
MRGWPHEHGRRPSRRDEPVRQRRDRRDDARGRGGEPLGATATAVTSVSLQPPLVLVCLARTSNTLAALRRRGSFAVNILHEQHAPLALAFARPGPCDAWCDGATATGPTGCPLLGDALAVLDCQVHAVVAAGDQHIVLGRVIATEASDETQRRPLLSFSRRLAGPLAL